MGKLFVVATPIGNLNDISKRAIDTLTEVDIIAAEDTRQTIKLLNHFNIKNKMIAYHKFNEKEKSNILIEELLSGKDIALVSDAGTPCISDPGYILIKKAHDMNIEVLGIPGPSATVTALSISGLDTSNYTFIGFLPTDNKRFNLEIEKIQKNDIRTFIIYESPKRIVKLVEKLKDNFPKARVFIASDLTKIHERTFFGTIENVYDIIKEDPNIEKGEYVLILEKASESKIEVKNDISEEAMIIDYMVKNNCTVKDAISNICHLNKNIKKNSLYEASLNLKKIIGEKFGK